MGLYDCDGYTEDFDLYDPHDYSAYNYSLKRKKKKSYNTFNFEKAVPPLIADHECKEEGKIREILDEYLYKNDEENAFLYLMQHKNAKHEFIAVCLKMTVEFGLLDNEKSKDDAAEIERLFVQQMYFNNTVSENDYICAIKLLIDLRYFEQTLNGKKGALQPLAKILVILINEKIVSLAQIASILVDARCSKAKVICTELIKHLIHCKRGNVEELKSLMNDIQTIEMIDYKHDLQQIFADLQMDIASIRY